MHYSVTTALDAVNSGDPAQAANTVDQLRGVTQRSEPAWPFSSRASSAASTCWAATSPYDEPFRDEQQAETPPFLPQRTAHNRPLGTARRNCAPVLQPLQEPFDSPGGSEGVKNCGAAADATMESPMGRSCPPMRPRFTDTARAGPLAGRHQQRNNRDACVGRVCPTLRITCEAHIDDDRAVVEHLQLQRFDWFM
jgi:hypothetical protein